MASQRKRTKRKSTSSSELSYSDSIDTSPEMVSSNVPKSRSRLIKIGVAVVLLAVVLGLLARRYKSVFVVGTVNGTPILTTELNGRLTNRFGSQMLEALIGEKLITQQAAKENIQVSTDEVNARITEIEQSLAGQMTLDETLKVQGITRGEFESQVRIQLMIDKMFADEVSVSAQEIDEFVTANAGSLTASGEAEKRAQAEKEVKGQKISTKFIEWFNKVKEEAKIERFL